MNIIIKNWKEVKKKLSPFIVGINYSVELFLYSFDGEDLIEMFFIDIKVNNKIKLILLSGGELRDTVIIKDIYNEYEGIKILEKDLKVEVDIEN